MECLPQTKERTKKVKRLEFESKEQERRLRLEVEVLMRGSAFEAFSFSKQCRKGPKSLRSRVTRSLQKARGWFNPGTTWHWHFGTNERPQFLKTCSLTLTLALCNRTPQLLTRTSSHILTLLNCSRLITSKRGKHENTTHQATVLQSWALKSELFHYIHKDNLSKDFLHLKKSGRGQEAKRSVYRWFLISGESRTSPSPAPPNLTMTWGIVIEGLFTWKSAHHILSTYHISYHHISPYLLLRHGMNPTCTAEGGRPLRLVFNG